MGDTYAIFYIANAASGYGRGGVGSQRIGLITSKSPYGPWKKQGNDGLILAPSKDPNHWTHRSGNGVCNPAFVAHPDGRFLLYFKAHPRKSTVKMGVAIADKLEGPYVIHNAPVTQNKTIIEDGYAFLWNGKVNLLTTDNHGMIEPGGGILWQSDDGINFTVETASKGYHRIKAYTEKNNPFEGTKRTGYYGGKPKFERPQVLMIDGNPAYLYVPAGANLAGTDATISYVLKFDQEKIKVAAPAWTVDSEQEWKAATAKSQNLELVGGTAAPTHRTASFTSNIKTFEAPRKAVSLALKQSSAWDNWEKIPSVKPEGVNNAPIFLPVADKDYYFFACRGKSGSYHGWHSTDMKDWKHLGVIAKSRWATTAEYKDGNVYLYYDRPNDGKPHLVIDSDMHDGKPGKHLGLAFDDPSGGSDCGAFRDDDGTFHLIYEDWSPINARKHSWDSPLAGHADSPDGIKGFEHHEHPAPVDERSKPTGVRKQYAHPNFKCEYEVHEPEQDAYGDWTAIKVGSRYYLFGDYHPKESGKSMRVAVFASDDINSRFARVGEVGENIHPDPTVGFAEGRFFLIVQNKKEKYDFASPGPWVDGVQARVGVDTDGNGTIDKWTEWQTVKETYTKKPGFARIVDVAPANLDLSDLPAGKGFQFEVRTSLPAGTDIKPVLDQIELTFQ
ncbi:MAG: hypothetical protein ABFR90_08850 [Planctomycetota bacterium]